MTTNFLFSSVGDNTNFDALWIDPNMNYDIYIIYYGDNDEIFNKYKENVKYIDRRKGSKFQNFKYFYDTQIDIINRYKHFFILDDDIIMNVDDINNMFKISIEYNLDICQPSFLSTGKISWNITRNKKNILLTYTNFVEVNTPLFNKISLDNLMKVLDYSLIGWGIDYLCTWVNGINKDKSYAIIHKISCINPMDKDKKSKKRELGLIPNHHSRAQAWKNFANKINCPVNFKVIEYSNIELNQ
jgi:hypothetical protein